MSNKDYTRIILERLLKKYHNRADNSNRRVIVKPVELYKKYADNNADIAEKQNLNESAERLFQLEFVILDHLKFSIDIEKIYLCEDKLEDIYEYLRTNYDIIPQLTLRRQAEGILDHYSYAGKLAQNYRSDIALQLKDTRIPVDQEKVERIEANLKMLRFIEENEENLYVREVSVLVYGDSKWFEKNNYDEICNIIRTALDMPKEENEQNDAILAYYHITPTEQEIFIKGSWKIEWDEYTLETASLKGGIGIASNDVQDIRRITVQSSRIMTVENKTSYQRMHRADVSYLYLGGFANRHQILFLQKVIQDNPEAEYYHFGDIDVGGFLIHRHLCRATGMEFGLYCMGIEQLKDERFAGCLKELTENDSGRIESLLEEEQYRKVAGYMKEKRVKLEQEIVSYYDSRL